MRSDIVPGATFPDYELPDHEDIPRKLSELQGDDPMILTLARGHYCPKEHRHVSAFHGWNKWDQGKLVAGRKVVYAR
jgi:peroxiredoxin